MSHASIMARLESQDVVHTRSCHKIINIRNGKSRLQDIFSLDMNLLFWYKSSTFGKKYIFLKDTCKL